MTEGPGQQPSIRESQPVFETTPTPLASGAPGSRGDGRAFIRFTAVGILLALILVAAALRFHRLSEIPPGLYYDGGSNGLDALLVLQGEHAIFFPERSNGREWLGIYPIALAISFLGRTMLAVRLPTALTSLGTVLVVFWLGQLLFGRDEANGRATPWRGLLIGGVGAGLMAVSLGHTILGRTAFRVNFVPLLLTLSLALLWYGWRQKSRGRILLAGACAGLLLHTYTPGRITPLLFLLYGLSFLATVRSDDKYSLRTELPRAGLFAGAAALAAAPMVIYFALHQDHLFLRAGQLWIFDPSLGQGDPLDLFLKNVWGYLLSFGFHGDPNLRHNLSGQPLLNPWESLFFWLGVAATIWRWQRPAYRLLFLWLVLLVLPATLAVETTPPNTVRIIGAFPAIFLLVAVGMWEAFHLLKPRIPALGVRAASIFQRNGISAAIAVGAVVGGLILGKGALTYRVYFEEWASAPGLNWAYDVEWTEWAQMLNALPSNENMVYLVQRAGSSGHNSFEFLYSGAASVDVIDTSLPTMPQKVELAMADLEVLASAKVVDWSPGTPWDHYEEGYVVALMNRYGRFMGSESHTSFQVHTYTDITLDRPWTFYEFLEPRTVEYDGGIALLGFALGHSDRQMSTESIVDLETERSPWVVLQVKTAPGLVSNFVMSLRLHDAEGRRVYQDDAPLMDLHGAHTSQWKADQPVDNLFRLEFPADLPPGEYELRLVIYDSQTKKPTAQLDVWNTEIGLARLHLSDAR